MRALGIPTIRDRAMQALYLLALDPVAETLADPNSYGFRKGRSTHDAIGQCFLMLGRKASAQWILEADIKSCFDHISHEWLLKHIPINQQILQKWLKAGYLNKNTLYPTDDGTPQGGIISPVLANLALDGLERKLRECSSHTRGLINLIRYADDFVVTGRTKELLETKIIPIIETHLKECNLELSQEKTRITKIDQGFDFLGQNVRKYKDKLLIKPSKKNTKSFLDKIRETIKQNATTEAGELIIKLNPMIRGWANYHRHIVSKVAFGSVDWAIFKCLWRWAKRRHPRKPLPWIKAKYFCTIGGNNWVFSGTISGRDNKVVPVLLTNAASVPIKRHIKIKAEANPYDRNWETYFEQRLDVQTEANLEGRRNFLRLWFEQNGLCFVCGDKITKVTGWHSHHIIYRVHGGADGNSNRVLLHPDCHRQVHSNGLEVVKSRLPKRR